MNNDTDDTVCAIVVTYNRKELLIECLESLMRQIYPLKAIYIIDNASYDGTTDLLLQKGFIRELPPTKLENNWEKCFLISDLTDNNEIKIHYVRMSENTGGAGGFYEGVKRAYESGYDWLWLMDGDASHDKYLLEKFSFYFKRDNVSALTNKIIDISGKTLTMTSGNLNFSRINHFMDILIPLEEESYKKEPVIEIELASFVSLLVNRKAVEKIGFPKREFFIHFDDWEFCLRLLKFGKILLITDYVTLHKEMEENIIFYIKKKFFGKIYLRHPLDNLLVTYFNVRNLIWTTKSYSPKLLFYKLLFSEYIKEMISIILFDNNKFIRIKFISNAYFDGFKGIFDNEKPKKLLYNNFS